MGERLTRGEVFSQAGWGHQVRYRLASGFANLGDTVLDAACGVGYGAAFYPESVRYIGVDKEHISQESFVDEFIMADLHLFEVDFDFELGISFETIEHLDDYSNLILQLKKASSWVICSVPVVPTVHINPWHKHDFQPLEFPAIFEDENWNLYQYLGQPQELSEIYIFKNRSNDEQPQ